MCGFVVSLSTQSLGQKLSVCQLASRAIGLLLTLPSLVHVSFSLSENHMNDNHPDVSRCRCSLHFSLFKIEILVKWGEK